MEFGQHVAASALGRTNVPGFAPATISSTERLTSWNACQYPRAARASRLSWSASFDSGLRRSQLM